MQTGHILILSDACWLKGYKDTPWIQGNRSYNEATIHKMVKKSLLNVLCNLEAPSALNKYIHDRLDEVEIELWSQFSNLLPMLLNNEYWNKR